MLKPLGSKQKKEKLPVIVEHNRQVVLTLIVRYPPGSLLREPKDPQFRSFSVVSHAY